MYFWKGVEEAMKKLLLASAIGAAVISTGCSDSGGGSSADISLTGGVALPEQMSLVTAQDDTTATGNSLSRAIHDTSSLAADSDYNTARQNTYVHLEAVRPISFIDSLLCFTNQSQPLAMNGEGNYVSWNDASRCFEERGDSGDSQGDDGNQVTQYVTFVANSSQASANSPLIFNAWIEDYAGQSGEGQGPTGIKILGEVDKTPTDENPFGVFSLAYGLLPDINADASAGEGSGEVRSSETTDGGASFTLYQNDTFGDTTCEVTASVDYNEATQTGLARTGETCTGGYEGSSAYALAVNADFVHVKAGASYADIEQDAGTATQCLARDTYTNVAWSYNLFNKADGSEVELNSGMQLKVDGNSDGTFESWGHIGYWGAWREDGQNFADGEAVQEATYDDSVGDSFTVKVSPGRLIKNSINSVALTDLGGVSFSSWLYEGDTYLLNTLVDINGQNGTNDSFEVVLEPNNTGDGFNIVGTREWNGNGETITPVNPAIALDLNTNVSIHMWSRQLGGGVNYISGSSNIRFFERSYVNGGETGTGELFDGGTSVTLKCFDRCLDVNIAASDVSSSADQDDVYVSNSSSTAQDYTFAQSDLTLKVGADSVVLSGVTRDNLQNSNFWQWGLDSGPMVLSSSGVTSAADLYTKIENGTVTEFYVWETGLEPWQQQIRLLDTASSVVAFDKPITIKYTHETANDRNGDISQDGGVFLLEYGGKGQLWGLPFVSTGSGDDERWNPVISLKDGTILGNTGQYIVKARDVEQKMASVDASNCASIPLTAPSQAIPTGVTSDVFGIGTMPDMTDVPPSLIDGEAVETTPES